MHCHLSHHPFPKSLSQTVFLSLSWTTQQITKVKSDTWRICTTEIKKRKKAQHQAGFEPTTSVVYFRKACDLLQSYKCCLLPKKVFRRHPSINNSWKRDLNLIVWGKKTKECFISIDKSVQIFALKQEWQPWGIFLLFFAFKTGD